MIGARAAMALYLALGVHVLGLLLVLLAPPPQRPPGSGQGLGLGLQLRGEDAVLLPAGANPGGDGPVAGPPSPVHAPSANARPARASAAAVLRPDPVPSVIPDQRSALSRTDAAQESAAGGGEADSYYLRLRRHLYRYRRELPIAMDAGRAEVALLIDAQGRILSLELQRRSQSALLDAEALQMLRRAEPLPTPPGASAMRVVVPVFVER